MRLPGLSLATAGAIGALACLASAPVLAHHSFAMFDMTKEVTVDGTIQNFQWTNPHIWIDLISIDKTTNQPVKWSFEGSGPSQLKPLGWKADDLKAGDKVTIVEHPLRSGANGGSLIKVILNGKELKAKA